MSPRDSSSKTALRALLPAFSGVSPLIAVTSVTKVKPLQTGGEALRSIPRETLWRPFLDVIFDKKSIGDGPRGQF